MATRNLQFAFQAGAPTGNQTPTNHMVLTVVDAGNSVVFGPKIYPATAFADVVALPIGAGHKATLVAYDNANATDLNPPTVTFDVTAPPPPPAPPDPILSPPILL